MQKSEQSTGAVGQALGRRETPDSFAAWPSRSQCHSPMAHPDAWR
ncbi:MAG: hypothetical protein QGF56_03930 [Verrucomicrobiota bacterium]|nr:hypothetical protein [Verrucomicrobiota bacterium]MDP6752814.1 hypothetical protein [Verrucomicrobiota bacterium]